jgi:ubiquinone/menaquinone biosynthesis C-methylase UbiE
MIPLRTTADLYNEEEFAEWSAFKGLLADEEALLRRHLYGLPRGSRILDVGTGAGRLLFELAAEGFTTLTGIDLSERLLEAARKAATQRNAQINFERQDAADLRFDGCSFDAVLALQQVLSMIERPQARSDALLNFHRVLAPGGLLLASCLSWESRWINPWVAVAIAPLKVLKGEANVRRRQYLPWLKLGQRPNFRFLFQKQPYTYWYQKAEFEQEITRAGFELIESTTSRTLLTGANEFAFGGMLYVVARKPPVLPQPQPQSHVSQVVPEISKDAR